MVQLSLKFASHVTGYLFVQTNPQWAYSTERTVKSAESKSEASKKAARRRLQCLFGWCIDRLPGFLAHFRHVAPDFDTKRVCIKIPATWEGLQACRVLEERGIATLATIMFCMEQAVLAAHAGCTFIAPYVNELRVHFDPRSVHLPISSPSPRPRARARQLANTASIATMTRTKALTSANKHSDISRPRASGRRSARQA